MLDTYAGPVQPGWIDYNGHMRDAYYALVFSLATDRLMELIGLDLAGRSRLTATLYTVEVHINYLREIKASDRLTVATQILEHDTRKIRILHSLHANDDPDPSAASEQMLIYIDTRVSRSAAMDATVLAQVEGYALVHQPPRWPQYVGRRIAIRK